MKFRTRAFREDPEINFIPLIDVLLVILIFLMVTTTYSRFAELQINLPTAESGKPPDHPAQVDVAVDAKGNYTVNKAAVPAGNAAALSNALKSAAGEMKDPVVVINADANAAHQSVVRVMEAAQLAGLARITFTTQAPRK